GMTARTESTEALRPDRVQNSFRHYATRRVRLAQEQNVNFVWTHTTPFLMFFVFSWQGPHNGTNWT
ncbi:MAG: hypothetical protein ACOY4U_04925, partial [Pseudomonadota bacterium]